MNLLNLNFSQEIKNSTKKFGELTLFHKIMTFFWLIGPFIYLIERSPADIWLTLISIIFLIRSIVLKDWKWINYFWIKCTFIFWIICIISSLLSPYLDYSLPRTVVWIRFPLYALAAQYWLAKDKEIRFLMLISICFGIFIMSIFITSEFIFDNKGRLVGPYGDHVPGNYFAKIGLPIVCIFSCIFLNQKIKFSIIPFLFLLLIISNTIFTGERINTLIIIFSSLLSVFIFKRNFKNLSILILTIITLFFSYFSLFRTELTNRFSYKFIDNLPINFDDSNPYWGAWRAGIVQGFETPLIGIGPNAFRMSCDFLLYHWLPGKNYCGNHPHNFYLQFFSEVGVIGLVFGSIMFFSIIYTCWSIRKYKNELSIFEATCFIIPLALFFPLQNHGNFFGQWGNLFIWFAIGLALSNVQKKV